MNIEGNTEQRRHWSRKAVDFVRSIGIPVTAVDGKADGFLKNIRVVDGGLQVVIDEIFPGDVLHEAGHLATIPAPFRHLANGNLKQVHEIMSEYLDNNSEKLTSWPEDPIARGIMQCSETEATAWQYAAAQAIGLPDGWIFPKNSYDNDSAAVMRRLKANSYMGINGLQAAGWTSVYANRLQKAPVYPQLAFWLHSGVATPDIAITTTDSTSEPAWRISP